MGIHGTIFYGLEEKKRFYPTRREREMTPGSLAPAHRNSTSRAPAPHAATGSKATLMVLAAIIDAHADDSDELEQEIDRAMSILIDGVCAAGALIELPTHWESAARSRLDPSTVNCGRCAVCGAWCTDRERTDSIPQLSIGARVEGRLLCDEHLPDGHPRHF